ncbi:hypothetical protein GF373_17410 [bacterium]|nr:hypothetical protein [bacterium]
MKRSYAVDSVDGIVKPKKNLPTLRIQNTTTVGKRLRRLHDLISGQSPKICIVRGEGIGDLLMTTPIARFIVEQFPHSEITYATNLTYLDGALPAVLQNNQYVNNIVDWQTYKKEDYDHVVDLHCPCVMHEKPLAKPIHRIDLFAHHVGVDLNNFNKKIIYTPTINEIEEVFNTLNSVPSYRSGNKRVVLVNPFASNSLRSMDPLEVKKAVSYLRKQYKDLFVVFTTHTSDYTKTYSFEDCSSYVAKDWPVRKLGALLALTNLLICPDSGLLHLAAALDVKTVGIFGPTDPRARVNLYPHATAVWPGETLQCSPCWYSSGSCRHKTCWKLINFSDIAMESKKNLDNISPLNYNKVIDRFRKDNEINKRLDIISSEVF